MKMSDDPISKIYCVGNSKAIIRARWNNLYTFELEYPRFIHSEFMTHRCLTADTVLTFDLPSGSKGSKCRAYQMTLGDFWDKWENGSSPHATRWGGVRRYDMKGRLNKMRLRSVDESTMEVTHTTVTDCWKVGVKPVYKITAGDFSVTCTADHLILTDSGWKELQDIAVGRDKVYASQCNLMAVVVDSIEYVGEEEVFDISVSSEYHNFLANGITVHNCFSRNASSSRAVPVERTIQNILNDPWVPSDVYKNCKGMQGKDIVNEDDYDIFCEEWQDAAFKAIEVAHKMIDNGFHKQHINRILEPFTKIKVIVTATEWSNFFDLRLSPDADPEIQHLAKAIKLAMDAVSNTYIYINAHGGRTLPYVNFDEMDAIDDLRILTLISAARCARVSYLNHDGSKPDILKDLALAKRLIDSGHMTPFEHQCRYSFDTGFQYNLRDFQSARYMLDHGIDLSAP
jgi:thymidylate synthase ThyX